MIIKIKYIIKGITNNSEFKVYDDKLILNYKLGEYLVGDNIDNIIAKYKDKGLAIKKAKELNKEVFMVIGIQEYEKRN